MQKKSVNIWNNIVMLGSVAHEVAAFRSQTAI